MLAAAGCAFEKESRALVDVNAAAASAYVFRGQTFRDRPVVQLDALLQLPTKGSGTASLGFFGNMDLTDEVGSAWMSPGAAGEFTQLDVFASYGRRIGDVDVAAGLRSYTWPNGESFRFAPFPSTSEAFARVGGELLGLATGVTAHYDIDEVHSLYVRGDVNRTLPLGGSLHLELSVWLGWSDADHSFWLYRTHEAAFSDLGGSAALRIDCDEITAVRIAVSGSTILDTDLRDWFDGNIDPDIVWATVSVGWSF
jgi:hypothetical protein